MTDYTTYLSDSNIAVVTQIFGNDGHLGTDIQFRPIYWSNLYFPKDGYVNVSANGSSGIDSTYGQHYEILCDDGTKYRMAHLRNRAVLQGANVVAGQYAGQQGNTGNTSGQTGIHLHLEYFEVGGTRVSPAPLMGFPDALGTYSIEFGGDKPVPRHLITSTIKVWQYSRRRRYNRYG